MGARYIVYITWSWHSARTKLPRKAPVDWSPVDEIANEVPLQAHDVAANDGTWPENTSPTRRCIPQWLLQISQKIPCFLWWKSTLKRLMCFNMLKRRIWSIGWWNVGQKLAWKSRCSCPGHQTLPRSFFLKLATGWMQLSLDPVISSDVPAMVR